MVNCPKCGYLISDDPPLLACPGCLERKVREAMLRHQLQFLPDVMRGKAMLRIARLKDQVWHLILIGDPDHGYCGQEIGDGWPSKRVDMSEGYPVRTCHLCREVYDRLVAEVRSIEVA